MAALSSKITSLGREVSTHSHPKVAARAGGSDDVRGHVSTHSHPKVAAFLSFTHGSSRTCFNTQPPEGGCMDLLRAASRCGGFNTQPPEGGCRSGRHARGERNDVSTHSHPKVAAQIILSCKWLTGVFQHTATRRWLHPNNNAEVGFSVFQHTATRRWLPEKGFNWSLK